MRKNWIIVLVAVFLVTSLFFAAYFWPLVVGEPKLRLEFFPPPTWKIKAGNTLEVVVGIPNDGRGTAKSVRLSLEVPEGFTGYIQGTNQREITLGTIYGGDGRSTALVITASSSVSLGTYTISVKLSAENAPEQVYTPLIEVQTS